VKRQEKKQMISLLGGIRGKKLNLKKGTYADDGIHDQKFFTEDEIHALLQVTGFKDIVTEKVLYP